MLISKVCHILNSFWESALWYVSFHSTVRQLMEMQRSPRASAWCYTPWNHSLGHHRNVSAPMWQLKQKKVVSFTKLGLTSGLPFEDSSCPTRTPTSGARSETSGPLSNWWVTFSCLCTGLCQERPWDAVSPPCWQLTDMVGDSGCYGRPSCGSPMTPFYKTLFSHDVPIFQGDYDPFTLSNTSRSGFLNTKLSDAFSDIPSHLM